MLEGDIMVKNKEGKEIGVISKIYQIQTRSYVFKPQSIFDYSEIPRMRDYCLMKFLQVYS